MKINYIIPFIFLFLLSGLYAYTQNNVEFAKANFPDDKKGLKEAQKNIKTGDKFYLIGSGKYPEAIEYFMKAHQFNPNNAHLNYKIGKSYFSLLDKEKALLFLEKAYLLSPAVADDIIYLIAQSYHGTHAFEKAISKYREFKGKLTPKALAEIGKDVDKKIKECEFGIEFTSNPVRVFIDNIGPVINTQYPEYSPIINADESMIIFTSRRITTTGGKISPRDGKYYEDIYISYRSGKKWGTPVNPGKPLNSDGHDATVGLSPDGQTLFIYRGDKGGDIYECRLKGNSWTKPQRLNKNINTKYHESGASLSPDGRRLFFVSDKPGGFGGRDIYVSELDKKGNWGPAKLLPGTINTIYDEEAVFMHPDGKTLYFSSKGHNSMGGFDIFKSVFANGQWSTPENLGYPINTAGDDVFFSISASGRHGYYSSARPGGYGDQDIYVITFLGLEKPMVTNSDDNLLAWKTQAISETVIEQLIDIKSTSLTLLKGRILDDLTRDPVEAKIILSDIDKNEELAVFSSNSATGRYLVSLPSGVNYGITINAEGYLFHSENFNIPEKAAYQEIEKDFYLKKIAIGSSIVLKNIFFDFDRATLRPESINELERLIKLMKDMPSLKIEISGHTDNIGSAQYNKTLSERRAKAVVDYLIEHGISANRLTYKGYGFDLPVATNDTEEGRQQNRRTEFKITGN
jgi:outer membrane protein OmpA-like peptidoglycan-associated protein/tetratricopeptide (TPR) repeat protein